MLHDRDAMITKRFNSLHESFENLLDRATNNGRLFSYIISDYGDVVSITVPLPIWDYWN